MSRSSITVIKSAKWINLCLKFITFTKSILNPASISRDSSAVFSLVMHYFVDYPAAQRQAEVKVAKTGTSFRWTVVPDTIIERANRPHYSTSLTWNLVTGDAGCRKNQCEGKKMRRKIKWKWKGEGRCQVLQVSAPPFFYVNLLQNFGPLLLWFHL